MPTAKFWGAVVVAAVVASLIFSVATGAIKLGPGFGNTGPATTGSYPLQGQIVDAATASALGATTTIDVIVPTYSSGWLSPAETVTQSSSQWTTKNNYPAGTVFWLALHSTAGNKFHDGLAGPFTAGGCGGTPNTCWFPATTTSCSNSCVWAQNGQLGLLQESTNTNVVFSLTDSLGKICGNTATASAAQSGNTVQGGSTGAVTQTLSLTITLKGGSSTTVTNYGVGIPYPPSNGQPPGSPGPGSTVGRLVAFLATNVTNGFAWIQQNGWTLTSTQPAPTIGPLFYKVLNPVLSTRQAGGTQQVSVPLDLTNGPGTGKNTQVALWIIDFENPSDAAAGIPDAAPTAFGVYSTISAVQTGFAFTSFTTGSGRWTGYTINCAVHQ